MLSIINKIMLKSSVNGRRLVRDGNNWKLVDSNDMSHSIYDKVSRKEKTNVYVPNKRLLALIIGIAYALVLIFAIYKLIKL